VAIGKEYALAVSLAMRLTGANLEDVALRTGVLGRSEDILSFLVSLDSAVAFNVSTRDVEVRSPCCACTHFLSLRLKLFLHCIQLHAHEYLAIEYARWCTKKPCGMERADSMCTTPVHSANAWRL
jgi:hypothetical protein